MLAVKKKVRHFGFKATFFASLYSKSLLFRQLGLDSQTVQSVFIFAGNWLALSYDSILETPITYLLDFVRSMVLQNFEANLRMLKVLLLSLIK